MSPKMHAIKRPKIISYGVKTVIAASVATLLCSGAYAAGLGKLTVLSSLGQPLHAEIELTSVSKDDAGSLGVKLAPVEAFQQANIELNPALFSLRFAIEQKAGRQFIRVTSTQPLNEPFVDMLLELSAENSRLVREYTFLLDPADLRRTQPVQVAAPVAPAPSVAGPAAPSVVETRTVPAQESSQKSAAEVSPASNRQISPSSKPSAAPAKPPSASEIDDYHVKNGDTLGRIANQTKPEGVSLDQMLVALQRANPHAFIGKNINRLRSGHILSVPDAQAVQRIDATEARRTVLAQAADFNSYRSKLAGQVGETTPVKSDEAKQSAGGKITAKVEEQATASNAARDKLQLSKAGAAIQAGSDQIAGGARSADNISNEKALVDANARVKELEKNVSELQELLAIKNKDLAQRQEQGNTALASADPAEPTMPAAEAVPATPADVAPIAAPPKVDKPVPPKAKVIEPVSEPSFLDSLLDSPMLLGVLAALVAALGGLGIYNARRKKQNAFQDSSLLSDSSLKANSLFGSTGGQSVDTNNSVFNSNFSPSASQLDTNEVDPVAEADVYIAYGRDAQAEEILKEALRTQPERNGVRVKLLEIYATRKDARAFEIMASELYSLTKGEGEDWEQAASLGIVLDPNNPIYAGGKPALNPASRQDAMTASTEQIEELDLAALLNTTQGLDKAAGTGESLTSSTSYFDNTVHENEIIAKEALDAPAHEVAEPEVPLVPEPELGHTLAPVDEPPVQSAGLDFDFDLGDFGSKEISTSSTTNDLASSGLTSASTSNTIDFDFLQDHDVAIDADTATDDDQSPPSTDVVEPSLDLGMAEPAEDAPIEATLAPTPADFDLSGISLDLGASDAAMPIEEGHPSNAAEMSTKLDLALAYQEIGDKEGARELLDEVVKGGSGEQIEKAKAMIQKIA